MDIFGILDPDLHKNHAFKWENVYKTQYQYKWISYLFIHSLFIRSFFICQFLYLIFYMFIFYTLICYTVHFFKFFLYGPICIIQNLLVVAQYLTYAVISKYSLSSCIKKNYSTTVGTWARAAFVRYNGSHVLIIHDWGYAYSREVRMGHLFILALLV